MPVNKEELLKLSTDELVAKIVESDAKLTEVQKSAPVAPTAAPAPVVAPVVVDPKLTEGTEKRLTEMSTQLTEANKKLADMAKDKQKTDVELQLTKLSEGVPKAVIDTMRELMLSDTGAKTYKFSETKADKSVVEVTLSLSECLIKLVEAFPTVELGESTVQAVPAADTISTDESATEITATKKYAEEHKIAFRDAAVILQKQGKIKGPSYAVAAR